MDERDFCYWLQGFFELSDEKELCEHQVDTIKDHLRLVFEKVTPDRSGGGGGGVEPDPFIMTCSAPTGEKKVISCSVGDEIDQIDTRDYVDLFMEANPGLVQ